MSDSKELRDCPNKPGPCFCTSGSKRPECLKSNYTEYQTKRDKLRPGYVKGDYSCNPSAPNNAAEAFDERRAHLERIRVLEGLLAGCRVAFEKIRNESATSDKPAIEALDPIYETAELAIQNIDAISPEQKAHLHNLRAQEDDGE